MASSIPSSVPSSPASPLSFPPLHGPGQSAAAGPARAKPAVAGPAAPPSQPAVYKRDSFLLAYQLIERLKIPSREIEGAIKDHTLHTFLNEQMSTAYSAVRKKRMNHEDVEKIFNSIYPKIRFDASTFNKFIEFYADCENIFKRFDVDGTGRLTFATRTPPPPGTRKTSIGNYQTVIKVIEELRMRYITSLEVLEQEGCFLTADKTLFIGKMTDGHLDLLIQGVDAHQGSHSTSVEAVNLTQGTREYVKIAATPEVDGKLGAEGQARSVDALCKELQFVTDLHKLPQYQATKGCPWAITPCMVFNITRNDPSEAPNSRPPMFGFVREHFKRSLHHWARSDHLLSARLDVCKLLSKLFADIAKANVVLRVIKPQKLLVASAGDVVHRIAVSDFRGAHFLSDIEKQAADFPVEFLPKCCSLGDMEVLEKLRATPKDFAKFVADKINGFAAAVVLFYVASAGHWPYSRIKEGPHKGHFKTDSRFKASSLKGYSSEFIRLLKLALNQKNPECRPHPQVLFGAMAKMSMPVPAPKS